MRFGHYWPKDPAAEKIRHVRRHVDHWPGVYGTMEMTYSTMPLLSFEPFEIGGTDGRDAPSGATAYERARPVRPLRGEYLAPITGHVRFVL